MTVEEKDLVMECLKEYNITGKVSIKIVEKLLSELIDHDKNK